MNNINQVGQDMVVCPYDKHHIMVHHRLGRHIQKTHPEELKVKREGCLKEQWVEINKIKQHQQPPPNPSQQDTLPDVDEWWDEDMVVCPYDKHHIMVHHRLGRHIQKTHPEELKVKREGCLKEQWVEINKIKQHQQPPPNPSQQDTLPDVDEWWDEGEPYQTYTPQIKDNMLINRKGFIFGKNEIKI
ncbi:hypothetical protein FQR65_LT18645 [Abscondita terminalis]|nr:hypothetical protein FQR65_LT18645 [Abscondita terminalis]